MTDTRDDREHDARYPIGRYAPPAELDAGFVQQSLAALESLPRELRTARGW